MNRRTRQIGVPLAFGARRNTILRMVVGDGLWLAASALVVGAPLSLAVGYSLRAFLYGVTPTDPAALAGACLGANDCHAARRVPVRAARGSE